MKEGATATMKNKIANQNQLVSKIILQALFHSDNSKTKIKPILTK